MFFFIQIEKQEKKIITYHLVKHQDFKFLLSEIRFIWAYYHFSLRWRWLPSKEFLNRYVLLLQTKYFSFALISILTELNKILVPRKVRSGLSEHSSFFIRQPDFYHVFHILIRFPHQFRSHAYFKCGFFRSTF